MTLDDYLRQCREKGQAPLHYKRTVRDIHGNVFTEEFRGPGFAGFSGHKGRKNGYGSSKESRQKSSEHERDKGTDDVVSELYGSEVVIRTRDGYHHGELVSYDGRFFRLKGYCFSKDLMDTFEYGAKSIFSEDAVVPAGNIVSVGEIPMVADEGEEEPWEATSNGSKYRSRF